VEAEPERNGHGKVYQAWRVGVNPHENAKKLINFLSLDFLAFARAAFLT
jgi:hypothetical protein